MENKKDGPGLKKITIVEVPYKILKEYFDFECGFVVCPGGEENIKEYCDYYDRPCPKFKEEYLAEIEKDDEPEPKHEHIWKIKEDKRYGSYYHQCQRCDVIKK